MAEGKSLVLAYLCFFAGGFFGLHLWYLKRDLHLVAHLCTFGGVCGLYLIVDFFRLPKYTRQVNEAPGDLLILTATMTAYDKPPFELGRAFVVCAAANAAFKLVHTTFIDGSGLETVDDASKSAGWFLAALLLAAAAAWVIANIGHQVVPLAPLVLGAAAGLACDLALINADSMDVDGRPSFQFLGVGAAILAVVRRQWRRTPSFEKTRGWLKRSMRVLAFTSVWWGVICMFVFYRAEIDVEGGEGKTTLAAVFTSAEAQQAWATLRSYGSVLYARLEREGSESIYSQVMEGINPEGQALGVLGLDETATPEVIKKRYRELAMKHHPDKHPSSEKEAAQARFEEIGKAYQALTGDRNTHNHNHNHAPKRTAPSRTAAPHTPPPRARRHQ